MKKNNLLAEYFFNRELSWLEFNEHVLEEAEDTLNPLFERLRFLSIVFSNLDEFFMIRVASLHDQINANFIRHDPSGLSPKEQVKMISLRTHKQVSDSYHYFNSSLKPALEKEKIQFIDPKDLDETQLNYVQEYYTNIIFPVITPMVITRSQPFPLVLNKTLNIALLLHEEDNTCPTFATIQVPSVLDRLVEIPSSCGFMTFILLEEIIKMNLSALFASHCIIQSGCYRITRNADLAVAEDEAEDLLTAVQMSLSQRKWGSAIRLELENSMDGPLLQILQKELELSKAALYFIEGPLDLTFLMKFAELKDYDSLKYLPIKTNHHTLSRPNEDIFESIDKKDVLLHHPYDSFEIIVELIKTAADDPEVLAIKQTLYRVGKDSPIIEALARAAENGKQVTVLLELKARFDEQNNILSAMRLETAGCHVIYGLVGLKTHCKLLLIVRRENDEIRRYVHLGTGNYNDSTAKSYTDFSLITSNSLFGADATSIFNVLSGSSPLTSLNKLVLSPIQLRQKFLELIHKETAFAKLGKHARIIAKLNSLVDTEIIEALYSASSAGVKIDLIVRGICCLKPDVPLISEHITVRSIVGRFLEHSRVYYFYGDGEQSLFLSSADLMTRNLDRRVELLFPIEDPKSRKKVMNVLELSLKDTLKARILSPDGTYHKVHTKGKKAINSQESFTTQAMVEQGPSLH